MFSLALSVLSALLIMSQERPAGQPIGMILQVQGETQIRHRSGAAAAARIADFLYEGDRVATGFGRATLLSCLLPETITLKEDTEIELGAEETKTLRGQILSRVKIQLCPVLRTALGSESLQRAGGLRGRGSPPIAVYLGGAVSTGHPVFEWANVEGAKSFRLMLRDAQGTLLWDYRGASISITYPDSKLALPPGDYQWELQAEADRKIVAAQFANFEVKPATLPGLNADSPRVLRATALEQAGYYAEAAAEFRILQKENPADPRITHHLAWLYRNAGLPIAFNEEEAKLGR